MKIENPLAFQFIMEEDIFLLKNEKEHFSKAIAQTTDIKTEILKLNYLGGNKKNFLIIVSHPETELMDEKHLAALQNTTKRLGFDTGDIAVFNLAAYPAMGFNEITDFFKPAKLVICGKIALPKGLAAIPFNQLQRIKDCAALYTFSFGEMMENMENKRLFWEQMKLL